MKLPTRGTKVERGKRKVYKKAKTKPKEIEKIEKTKAIEPMPKGVEEEQKQKQRNNQSGIRLGGLK